jgi:hypothetical protein
MSSRPTLKRTVGPPGAKRVAVRRGCAVEGNDEAFVAGPRIAEAEQLEPVEHAATPASDTGFSTIEKRPEEPVKSRFHSAMARMIGQGRVDDAQHLGPVAEPCRKRQPLAFRLAQPKLHRAQAAQREKHVLGAGRDRHQLVSCGAAARTIARWPRRDRAAGPRDRKDIWCPPRRR